VPFSCNFMYEIGISFYRRDFFSFLEQARVCWCNDRNEWSVPLESGSFCYLDATLYLERVLVIREYILSQEQLSPVSIDFQTDSRFLAAGGRESNITL
jgi:hypothetical protein